MQLPRHQRPDPSDFFYRAATAKGRISSARSHAGTPPPMAKSDGKSAGDAVVGVPARTAATTVPHCAALAGTPGTVPAAHPATTLPEGLRPRLLIRLPEAISAWFAGFPWVPESAAFPVRRRPLA